MTAQLVTLTSMISVSSQQVSSQLADEVVILNLKDGTYYSLDAIGALIWNTAQRPCSIETICAAVLAEYEVDAAQCAADVLALVEDMVSVGMIEVQDVATASVLEPASR